MKAWRNAGRIGRWKEMSHHGRRRAVLAIPPRIHPRRSTREGLPSVLLGGVSSFENRRPSGDRAFILARARSPLPESLVDVVVGAAWGAVPPPMILDTGKT